MMRSMVAGASWVCRVAKTRWPVSAAVRAVAIVSRSRSSPTRMTSGSCRSTRRQRLGERFGVRADLALADDRALVAVQELDRVLDRHDVQRLGPVDDVDERGQGGRLARSGRAGDQHQAAPQLGEAPDRFGQAEAC